MYSGYLYDSANKTLKRLTPLGKGKTYNLTPLESKLVEVLSNGIVNTKKEIGNYVFGYYDKTVERSLSNLRIRLVKKTKLKVDTITKRRL